MKKSVLPVLLLAALAAWGSAGAANPTAPAGQARVAGGASVPLARSARTAEEWSARRPQFRSLRPRIRSNLE